ncbi:MFS transporter [Micromonospora auratinigra]|uniref:Major Facilitator Superfamily protein n=1 Tax=Micromonospora auratinigra TaxID=261654 RepID=A0A1A8Z113_9ACTN|nr:MFS transporter [Micromonospora auratinigra]SBT37428.1 Major Facilitator Superfamily protein [Micromonospora auratinigra]
MPSVVTQHPGSWLVARGLIPADRPQRVLALATFVNMVGSGVFMVAAALFFTRSVGLPAAQVGLALGAAAVVGLLAGVPVGHLADRYGPRGIYLLMLGVQGVAMAALTLVDSFWPLVAVLCVGELARSAGAAARGPLVRAVGGAGLSRYRAYLRSVANLAGSAAAVAAGFALQADTRAAYVALVLGNAASFLACAAIIARLPAVRPVPAPGREPRWAALRDRGYVTVTVLDGIMSIHHQVLLFALPLWIVGRTDAPRWLVGLAALVNTALVVLLQVRASRGVDDPASAGRAVRRSGVAFLAGMAAMAGAAGLPARLAVGLILVGICVHTVGELWHTAGSLELRFSLAPAHAQGQYSGLFGLGSGLANVLAPSVLALCCVSWGVPGWLLLGGVFLAVGLAVPAVTRWAQRTGPGSRTEPELVGGAA